LTIGWNMTAGIDDDAGGFLSVKLILQDTDYTDTATAGFSPIDPAIRTPVEYMPCAQPVVAVSV
jgi:hypothetical protein